MPDQDDELERLAELMLSGEAAYILNGRVYSLAELPGGYYA
jgi:hypothetical protein